MSIKPKNVREILSKNILADGFDPIIDLDKSHGSWIVDQRDGSEYLDMFSMYASGAVGYNHPYIVKNQDVLGKISINKTTLSDIYNIYYADFIETFNKYAAPNYLKHAFFIDGGALAVENALKTAFDWKKRLNLKKGINKEGDKIIYFNQAFHGRSGYTMTLTNTSDPRKTMYYPKFDWFKVDNPHLSFPLDDVLLEDVIKKENSVIENIKNILNKNKDDVAAIIIEPIQGEGGDNHFRNEFMILLKELCDSNEMLLIFDEVQTGVGITGKMWAHEHFSVKPDIISFGKKTQVCGMLAGDKVFSMDKNVFKESSRINSTFGGNLVDMYRFKLILEIMCNENLLSNAKEMGWYLLSKINDLSLEFPGFATNPRGVGLFCAFDLPSTIERDKFISLVFNEKLMILGSGDASIRFRPHLNVSKNDIDVAIDIISQTLKKMLN
tara:strand:+ start:904 stop:2220 length:1317 start_codon:yes stop_codon:yes gene_type:complete